jgi:hypothetical protein
MEGGRERLKAPPPRARSLSHNLTYVCVHDVCLFVYDVCRARARSGPS